MKLPDLREQLKPLDKNQLEKITTTIYKLMPKTMKEDADQLIAAIIAGEDVKGSTQKETIMDFDSLKYRIEEFIENVNAGNYIAPNRIIPKAHRSKWRFQVKSFIKELEKLNSQSAHYVQSVKLLKDLYILLCRACNYYLFSTDDPFQSIGMPQGELCYIVINRMCSLGCTRASIREMIKLVTLVGLDRYTLHLELELILLDQLKDEKSKQIALEESLDLLQERECKIKALRKYDERRYSYASGIEELCNMQFIFCIALKKTMQGIANYFNYSRQDNKEITLYICLDILSVMEEEEEWVRIYEDAVKHNIQPREELKTKYRERLIKIKG